MKTSKNKIKQKVNRGKAQETYRYMHIFVNTEIPLKHKIGKHNIQVKNL